MNGGGEESGGGHCHPGALDVEEGEDRGREERSSAMKNTWRRFSLPSDRIHSCGTLKASSSYSDLGLEDAPTHRTDGESGRARNQPSVWQSFKKAGTEFNQDTRKMFHYFGRKLRSRHGPRETKVKEIHIVPGDDLDRTWARRMSGSGTSCPNTSSDPST